MRLYKKIKARVEQIIGASASDKKLAIKILVSIILRKTLFKALEIWFIFPLVTRKSIRWGNAMFPISNLSTVTSKENCLEYLFGIYEPGVQRVIQKNLNTGGGIYRYRCECRLFYCICCGNWSESVCI
jgi:hypothetical protein